MRFFVKVDLPGWIGIPFGIQLMEKILKTIFFKFWPPPGTPVISSIWYIVKNAFPQKITFRGAIAFVLWWNESHKMLTKFHTFTRVLRDSWNISHCGSMVNMGGSLGGGQKCFKNFFNIFSINCNPNGISIHPGRLTFPKKISLWATLLKGHFLGSPCLAIYLLDNLLQNFCRGSETVRRVGSVRHRDLRSDPDTSFAGPDVWERPRKSNELISQVLLVPQQSIAYQIVSEFHKEFIF